MPRREHTNIAQEKKTCYFYAPLIQDLTPTISHNSDYTTYRSSYNSISSNGLYLSADSHGIVWNCNVPVNTNLTFGCFLKRTSGSGVNYSFGAATKNNARYYGLQLAQLGGYWLVTEYLYFCSVSTSYMPTLNSYDYINWTIIYNGNKNYTCKFYKNGVLVETRTFKNTQWLGMTNSYFAISHFTNSMYGYYKHFSCYEELTDDEILQLYQRGGIPS